VTQQNSAMVEESTAASHNLAQEAEELARLVAKFKLGDRVAEPSTQRARPAAAHSQARPQASSGRGPVAAMKTISTGSGQAATLLAHSADEDGWADF
jgi:methyl-accepting chemotaxis protein